MGQECEIDSLIINKKQAKWISSKIVESTTLLQENQRTSVKHDAYKLTLLYRQSRDGNIIEKFRALCINKGPTIAIGKVSDTEEIFGGYNPIAWGLKENYSINTKESFIFALDRSIDKSIVSFVDHNSLYATYDNNKYFPTFGNGHDLFFGNNKNPNPYAK